VTSMRNYRVSSYTPLIPNMRARPGHRDRSLLKLNNHHGEQPAPRPTVHDPVSIYPFCRLAREASVDLTEFSPIQPQRRLQTDTG